MKGIRQPTLADEVLAFDAKRFTTLDPQWYERRCDDLRLAKRFVLDPQAATYLGKMIRENPRVIADAQDFAITPFPLMWVELPFKYFYREVTGREPDNTGDLAVGYLFKGPMVWVASRGYWKSMHRYESTFIPVEYVLHKPMTVEEQLHIAQLVGTSRLGLDLWFWGESAEAFIGQSKSPALDVAAKLLFDATDEDIQRQWDKEGMRALRDNHSVQMPKMRNKDAEKHFAAVMDGSGGDLRNIVALLLFLNRTQDIQYQGEVGMAHAVLNRKRSPLLPHRVITLKLDPLPRLRTLSAGMGVKRRLHDVRGHYAHDKKAKEGCPHGTQKISDWGEWWEEYAPLRWRCTGCNGKRWWQPWHKRGHAEIGVVSQIYNVQK